MADLSNGLIGVTLWHGRFGLGIAALGENLRNGGDELRLDEHFITGLVAKVGHIRAATLVAHALVGSGFLCLAWFHRAFWIVGHETLVTYTPQGSRVYGARRGLQSSPPPQLPNAGIP